MSTVLNDEQARLYVAKNISFRLGELGMSQADLGRAIQQPGETLQSAKQRVYRYVNALNAIEGAHHLANIAEALNVTIESLIKPPRKTRHAG